MGVLDKFLNAMKLNDDEDLEGEGYLDEDYDDDYEEERPKKRILSSKYEEDEEVKIIRTKKFDIKPMYPEDACVQMELLGHNFFVFCNAETDQVNVVYKRKGNTYGLIEPDFNE